KCGTADREEARMPLTLPAEDHLPAITWRRSRGFAQASMLPTLVIRANPRLLGHAPTRPRNAAGRRRRDDVGCARLAQTAAAPRRARHEFRLPSELPRPPPQTGPPAQIA